jgi:dolichol kinase
MSGEKAWFWYFVLGIIYIALLVVLVRPGSDATNAVLKLSDGLASIIKTAVGGTTATTSNVPPGGILT